MNSETFQERYHRSSLHGAGEGSVESFATDVLSEFGNLSMLDGSKAKHDGVKRYCMENFTV